MSNQGFTYIMMSKSGVLYIGVTSNLAGRAWEHKNDILEGFTKKNRCHKLVFYEIFDNIKTAIDQEKRMKGWKLNVIRKMNPQFKDLWEDISEGFYVGYSE